MQKIVQKVIVTIKTAACARKTDVNGKTEKTFESGAYTGAQVFY